MFNAISLHVFGSSPFLMCDDIEVRKALFLASVNGFSKFDILFLFLVFPFLRFCFSFNPGHENVGVAWLAFNGINKLLKFVPLLFVQVYGYRIPWHSKPPPRKNSLAIFWESWNCCNLWEWEFESPFDYCCLLCYIN